MTFDDIMDYKIFETIQEFEKARRKADPQFKKLVEDIYKDDTKILEYLRKRNEKSTFEEKLDAEIAEMRNELIKVKRETDDYLQDLTEFQINDMLAKYKNMTVSDFLRMKQEEKKHGNSNGN